MIEPGFLDLGAGRRRADRLDRRDLRCAKAFDIGNAGARCNSVDMDRAGAAQRHTAAELRTRHTQNVAQHPQQRCIAIDVDVMCCPINIDGEGHMRSPL